MAKQSGLGQAFYVGGSDLSSDTQSGTQSGGPAPGDFTDITQSAHARQGLLRSGAVSMTMYYDPLAAHPVLSALPTADVVMTYCTGVAIGAPAYCVNAKQVNYDGTRATDGMYLFKVDGTSNSFGAEWGNLLTAGMRTDTAATSPATGFDTGGSLSFGAQAYLHVAAFTGTDVTMTIQDSADNTTFANITGLSAFAQVTGSVPLAQRIASSNTTTIRRYLRVITSTTGGFTSATFAVIINKNPVAGVTF